MNEKVKDTPLKLYCSGKTIRTVTLVWNEVQGSTGYRVYQKSGVEFEVVQRTEIPKIIITVEAEKSYTFKVDACSDMEVIESSNELEVVVSKSELAVMTRTGNMIGIIENGVHRYAGIRFAEAPTGENGLRWKKPVAVKSTDEDTDASEFGKSALQNEWHSELVKNENQDEDCLSLNIWTKDPFSEEKKAVMVFIHGGAHIVGESANPLYHGQTIVENHGDDVVYVSVNYRLNSMGLIDLSSIKDGEKYKAADFADAPWLCLYDNIAALQWIQENIGQFGGDADNVMIFGESAGGAQVSLLPLMKECNVLRGTTGKPLFRRIIQQSGSAAIVSTESECAAAAEVIKTGWAKEHNGGREVTMDDLMALDAKGIKLLNTYVINHAMVDGECVEVEEVTGAQNYPQLNTKNECPFIQFKNYYYKESPEAVLTPRDLMEAYQEIEGVDMMIGTTANEWNYWVGEMTNKYNEDGSVAYGPMPTADDYFYFNILYGAGMGADAESDDHRFGQWNDPETGIKKILEDNGDYEAFVAAVDDDCKALTNEDPYSGILYETNLSSKAITEWSFRAGAVLQARNHMKASSGKTYLYYWKHPSTIEGYGACHAVELPYVFGYLGTNSYSGENDAELSKLVQNAWVSFAKTGIPSAIDQTEWKEYGPDHNTMVIHDVKQSRKWTLEPHYEEDLIQINIKDNGLFDKCWNNKFL